MSENGKTCKFSDKMAKIFFSSEETFEKETLADFSDPLGGVKNLKVVDPTTNSLTVRWDPAVGNVRSYKVFYKPEGGDGEELMVRTH